MADITNRPGAMIPLSPSQPATGLKFNSGKLPTQLLSPIALAGTSAVLAFGAKKYSAHNWRGGLKWGDVIGAILRHLFAMMMGEDLDPETKLPHVDHLGCEIMFLQELYRTRKDLDDRYKLINESTSIKSFDESYKDASINQP